MELTKQGSNRIAFVIPSLLPLGGVERTRIVLAEQFLARGYQVDFVIANEPHDLRGYLPDSAHAVVFKCRRLRQFVRPFARYIAEYQPDAIMASMWPLTSAAICGRMLAGSKSQLLVSDHNPLSVQYRSWGQSHRLLLRASLAATYRLADLRVGVSSGVADDVSRLSGIPRHRFQVIRNPVYLPCLTEATQGDSMLDAWRGWKGPRIIAAGRIKRQKNYPLMFEAFARTVSQKNARLMILGTGELEQEMRVLAESMGLGDRIIFTGQVQDVRPYYQSADLFVLSSDYEGFGNVLVEALSCGLPVVSTACPTGPAEILENGKWGRLVPVGDAQALSNAMLKSLAGTVDREALKIRAADFAPNVVADEYLQLLFPELCRSDPGVLPKT